MRRSIIAFASAILGFAAPADAKPGYPVDLAIGECQRVKARHRIVVGSSAGLFVCIHSDGGRGVAPALLRNLVAGECTKALPFFIRGKAPCRVVWHNGKVTDRDFYRDMTREFRIPVRIKSWDGVNRREIDYRGHLVAGKVKGTYRNPAHVKNLVRLMLDDGRELCRGEIGTDGDSPVHAFEVTCLGKLRLEGRARQKGLIKIDGHYRPSAFDAEVSNPPNRMRVWTP